MSYITDENNLSTYSNKNSLLDDSKYSQKKKEESILRTTYKFKVILLGESSVGKTSILHRFIGQKFAESYRCTVGVEFKIKSILLDPYTIAELKIWDTCGEEKFRSVTRQYYNDANGIVLLFDLNDRNSYNALPNWLKDIKNYSPKNAAIIIVGNKSDLERKVSENEILYFTQNEDISYIEVSAKSGVNIELIFEKLSKEMVIKSKEVIDDNKPEEMDKYLSKSFGIQSVGKKSNVSKKENEVSRC